MLLMKVTEAKYVEGYKIDLTFNDGTKSVIDLKTKVFEDHRKIFEPLRDIVFFKKFTLNRWTIEWPNELDLAPEYLYELSDKQAERPLTDAKNP